MRYSLTTYLKNQELFYLHSVRKNLLEVAAVCISQAAPCCERVCHFFYPKVDIALPKLFIGCVITSLLS